MIAPGEFLITMLCPDGTRRDLSDVVSLRAVGSIEESLEDDLLVLTHSDFGLTVQDEDGTFAQTMRETARTELWGLEIDRLVDDRRAKWRRIFAGILDVPLSVEIDHTEHMVSVQAYSFSKLLEDINVESLKRLQNGAHDTPPGMFGQTVSATSGNTLITFDPGFSGGNALQIGDVLRIDDGTNAEEHIIREIPATNQVRTINNFDNTFAAGSAVEFLTPWPTHLSIRDAALQILALIDVDKGGSITDVRVEIDKLVGTRPFLSGFNSNGQWVPPVHGWCAWEGKSPESRAFLPIDAAGRGGNHELSMFDEGNNQDIAMIGTNPIVSPPVAGLTLGDLAIKKKIDWTPYEDRLIVGTMTVHDDLQEIPTTNQNDDETDTQHNFGSDTDDEDFCAAADNRSEARWTLRHNHAIIGNDPQVRLFRNGALLGANPIATEGGGSNDRYRTSFLEFIPAPVIGQAFNFAMISTEAHNGVRELHMWRNSVRTLVASGSEAGGGIRFMGVQRRGFFVQNTSGNDRVATENGQIRFWDVHPDDAGPTSSFLLEDQPRMLMWTFRTFGDHIACLYLAGTDFATSGSGFQSNRETRCRVWHWPRGTRTPPKSASGSIEHVSDFLVTKFAHKSTFMTRARIQENECAVINVNGFAFCLSTNCVGGLAYLNLDDVGGGQTLKDIAVLTASYLHIDHDRIAHLRGRDSQRNLFGDANHTPDIVPLPETLLSHIERPLNPDFATSVRIEGKDRDGEEFEIISGDKSDSSNRVDIDSSLIRDSGVAEAVGQAYADLLVGERSLRELSFEIPDDTIHVNNLVSFEGRVFRVVKSEIDFGDETQKIEILEIGRDSTLPPAPGVEP